MSAENRGHQRESPLPARPVPVQSASPIELCIDKLVLHGFVSGHQCRIADALEAELGRLLAERGAPRAWQESSEQDNLRAEPIRMQAEDGPEALGRAIAERIYASGSSE